MHPTKFEPKVTLDPKKIICKWVLFRLNHMASRGQNNSVIYSRESKPASYDEI